VARPSLYYPLSLSHRHRPHPCENSRTSASFRRHSDSAGVSSASCPRSSHGAGEDDGVHHRNRVHARDPLVYFHVLSRGWSPSPNRTSRRMRRRKNRWIHQHHGDGGRCSILLYEQRVSAMSSEQRPRGGELSRTFGFLSPQSLIVHHI